MVERGTTFGVLVFVLAHSGCLLCGPVRIADHRFETSAAVRMDSGELDLGTSKRGHRVDLIAADDSLSFAIQVKHRTVLITLANGGESPVKLLLDEARYIGADGTAHRVYAAAPDRIGPAPDRVAPGGEATVFVWPEDWLRGRTKYGPGIWKGDSPLTGESTVGETRELKRTDPGRSFEVILPVEIDGTTKSYRFTFTVKKVRIKIILWA